MEESITGYIDIRASRKAVDDIKVWGKIPRCAMRDLYMSYGPQKLHAGVIPYEYLYDAGNKARKIRVRSAPVRVVHGRKNFCARFLRKNFSGG